MMTRTTLEFIKWINVVALIMHSNFHMIIKKKIYYCQTSNCPTFQQLACKLFNAIFSPQGLNMSPTNNQFEIN